MEKRKFRARTSAERGENGKKEFTGWNVAFFTADSRNFRSIANITTACQREIKSDDSQLLPADEGLGRERDVEGTESGEFVIQRRRDAR